MSGSRRWLGLAVGFVLAATGWAGEQVTPVVQQAPTTKTAGDQAVVEVDGVGGIKEGNVAAARDEALADARRNAVEQGIGVFVSSETLVENYQLIYDRILTKSREGMVANVKVLQEGPDQNFPDQLYRVRIRALVSLVPIAQELLDLNELYQRRGRPRFMVVLEEKSLGQEAGTHIAETELNRLLTEKGFQVVDPQQTERIRETDQLKRALRGDKEAANWLVTQFGSEILLIGRADSRILQERGLGGLISAGAQIEARVFYTSTAEIMTARTVVLGGPDPETGQPIPGIPAAEKELASRLALQKAAQELLLGKERYFLAQMITYWITNPTVVVLKIAQVDFLQLEDIVERIRQERLVISVLERSFINDLATLEVRTHEGVRAFVRRVARLKFEDFRLKVTGFQGIVADLEVVPLPKEAEG